MKKMMILAAGAAIALSACSEKETIDPAVVVESNPNAISFASNTTRAEVNDLTDVQGGFQIFGVANGESAWYNTSNASGEAVIDGTYDYFYTTAATTGTGSSNANWYWRAQAGGQAIVEAPMWPTDLDKYPMTFYAAYPIIDAMAPATPAAAMTQSKTITTDRFAQVDELAAYAAPDFAPPGGKLSLIFNHTLSRINVGVTPGAALTVEVQGINLRNAISTATYDYKTSATTNQSGWSATSTPATYPYREGVFAGSTTATTGDDTYQATHYSNNTGATTSAVQSNNSGVAGDLMLIPQTLPATTISATDFAANETAITASIYLEVFYRVASNSGVDMVGRTDITSVSAQRPYYEADGVTPVTTLEGWNNANDIAIYPGFTAPAPANSADYVVQGTGGAVTEPAGRVRSGDNLYIRSIIPLNTDGVTTVTDWDRGSAYYYDLQIGGTGAGGYYADNQYYDEAGNPTGLYHQGTPGKPIFSEERIHFNVSVAPWGSAGDVDIE